MCIKSANKHYAVIGRIPGDDEDSCYVFKAADSGEAIALFKESVLDEEGDISGLETDSDGEPIIFIPPRGCAMQRSPVGISVSSGRRGGQRAFAD